ncbi:LOW QUALITY PROTEIN: hypothetical protein MXB_127, partial [Myxobolus squamalis]
DDQKLPWDPNVCPAVVPLNRVTLKGGLASGEFTDIGPVESLTDCYDICCQKNDCDLAFVLALNCFTVSCRKFSNDTNIGCVLETSVESSFNPEAAHVLSRINLSEKSIDPQNLWQNEEPKPTTPIPILKYTVNSNMEALQKFNDQLQADVVPNLGPIFGPNSPYNSLGLQLNNPYYFEPNNPYAFMNNPYSKPIDLNREYLNFLKLVMPFEAPKEIMKGYFLVDANKLSQDTYLTPQTENIELSMVNSNKELNQIYSDCKLTPVLFDTSLKHGKNAGKFIKLTDMSQGIDSCAKYCCETSNASFTCEVAFVVGKSCYLVDCFDQISCHESKAPLTNYNPQLVFVRNITTNTPLHNPTLEPPIGIETTTIGTDKSVLDSYKIVTPAPIEKNIKIVEELHSNCHHEQILWNMTVEGASSSSRRRYMPNSENQKSAKLIASNVKDMKKCADICCLDSDCDAAILEEENCLSVSCSEHSRACVPVLVKSSKKNTQLAFMSRMEVSIPKTFFTRNSNIPMKNFYLDILYGGVAIGSALIIVFSVLATVISAKAIKNRKKSIFNKKKITKNAKKNHKKADETKNQEEEEQDRLEELLSRGKIYDILYTKVSASFSKSRSPK